MIRGGVTFPGAGAERGRQGTWMKAGRRSLGNVGSATLFPARRRAAASTLAAAAGAAPIPASAETFDVARQMGESQGVLGLALMVPLALITTIVTLMHIFGRRQFEVREARLTRENADLRARLDRANVFLSAESQIVVAWGTANGEPDIDGDLSLVMEIPIARRALAFGTWLAPGAAQDLDQFVDRLRHRGERFRLPVVSLAGRHLETEGRAVGGRAVLRIRDVSGSQLELAVLRERHAKIAAEAESFRLLLDSVPQPMWMRGGDDEMTWVNAAYAKAVEAADPQRALAGGTELLDRADRDRAKAARRSTGAFVGRVRGVVEGERHLLEVAEIQTAFGAMGHASDLSELEQVRADLERQMTSHTQTLDQLSTAVAIFNRARRLVFHNAAYRQLWSLEPAFLEQGPTDGEILDRLRAAHRLPEQTDFKGWKANLLNAYLSVETSEQVWHLPDRRTLRVVVNPSPGGGVTYLFDDLSERYRLLSQYNSLFNVQTETLNSLSEAVAVFGSDGRLKLCNPALSQVWDTPLDGLDDNPHIDALIAAFSPALPDKSIWDDLRAIVLGLPDTRARFERRLELVDGKVLQCAATPLPDGAVLVTFADVSAAARFAAALTERNKALLDAEKLRNDFVHHVSYELRSPLTNIIGFIHLLTDGSVGTLNERQREYTGYILQSSGALLAIINDILDIATIDADAMELELGEVDVRATIEAAREGVRDRLAESSIRLNIVVTDDIGVFEADAKRVRQILFNLLSNAIGFSAPGQTVTLAAMRRDDSIIFKVSDQGRGMAPEMIDKAFDRFETKTAGSRHRGVGLGLSIVRAFVELHGGECSIQSALGEGTTATCVFPARQADRGRRAAVA